MNRSPIIGKQSSVSNAGRNPKYLKGNDGDLLEIRKNETHIQYKYANGTSWLNLIAIDDLKGEPGEDGAVPAPESLLITRDMSGFIATIVKASGTTTITRNISGEITVVEGPIYRKEILRSEGVITGVNVVTL
jgi:hypothetical protein